MGDGSRGGGVGVGVGVWGGGGVLRVWTGGSEGGREGCCEPGWRGGVLRGRMGGSGDGFLMVGGLLGQWTGTS